MGRRAIGEADEVSFFDLGANMLLAGAPEHYGGGALGPRASELAGADVDFEKSSIEWADHYQQSQLGFGSGGGGACLDKCRPQRDEARAACPSIGI